MIFQTFPHPSLLNENLLKEKIISLNIFCSISIYSRSACWLLFTLNRWTSAALQMKRPSQSSGGLHYHRSDLLAID
ncbi:hypothetical protein KU710_23405, partial [Salmonella enterica subsp. enterica serovar Give]|nr:hypothetical protein [Salmonella enterica subsp. enterica serovar Give]